MINGALICNSEMGITVIDLFNDIMTSEVDLEQFLCQFSISQTGEMAGKIIKGEIIIFFYKYSEHPGILVIQPK